MRNHPPESKSLHFLWGVISFSIYFALIGLLLIYFNQHSIEKPKHFVKKDEKRIQVMEVEPIKAIRVKTIVEKPKPKKMEVLKPIKPKVIPKKEKVILKEKIVKKKSVKKKVIKKKDENKTKPQKKKPIKVNTPKVKVKKEVKKTSDLFSSVKTVKKEIKVEVPDKPKSAIIKDNKKSYSGVENAYFAKVQSLLETWPAQSDYAGEMAMVSLYVKPTGLFEFKVKSQSDNVDFNLGLIDFLMQLQRMGLGSHNAGKTYEFIVEFIAKE